MRERAPKISEQVPKVKKNLVDRIPSTVVFLFMTLVLGVVLTYILPAGQFERVVDPVTNITKVDPDSFHIIESNPAGILDMFKSIYTGLVGGGGVIFLVFLSYFWVFTMVSTGAFESIINKIIKSKALRKYYIPIFMVMFALAGSVYGEITATYGLLPLFIGLAILMGHDAIVGMCVCGMACAVGSAVGTTNPYTTALAHNIAELPLFSGQWFRWIALVVLMAPTIWYTMRYANKVQKEPEQSVVHDLKFDSYKLDESAIEKAEFTGKQKTVIAIFLLSILAVVIGSIKFNFELTEVAMVFTIGGLLMSIIAGYNADRIAENFCKACSEVMMVVILVGLARSVLVILQDSSIIDTIIYGLYQPIKNLPVWACAEGMLIVQTLLNFFIPSGTGQAVTVMPIMIPLADLSGVTRQIATTAFTFGDGFSNLLYPTAHIGIMLGVSKIPFGRWAKFYLPLFVIHLALQMALIFVAVLINYGPA